MSLLNKVRSIDGEDDKGKKDSGSVFSLDSSRS